MLINRSYQCQIKNGQRQVTPPVRSVSISKDHKTRQIKISDNGQPAYQMRVTTAGARSQVRPGEDSPSGSPSGAIATKSLRRWGHCVVVRLCSNQPSPRAPARNAAQLQRTGPERSITIKGYRYENPAPTGSAVAGSTTGDAVIVRKIDRLPSSPVLNDRGRNVLPSLGVVNVS